MNSKIKIKPLNEGYIAPKRVTSGSAALDAFLPSDYRIKYGRMIIPLGFAIEMPINIALDSRTRSGYAAKGLLVYDKKGKSFRIDADIRLGLIDSDYRGEVGVIINCRSLKTIFHKLYVRRGQAISQLAFWEVPEIEIIESEELTDTERGIKGFGAANKE